MLVSRNVSRENTSTPGGFDFCFRKAYTVPVDDRFHPRVNTSFALLSPMAELCLGHGCKVVRSSIVQINRRARFESFGEKVIDAIPSRNLFDHRRKKEKGSGMFVLLPNRIENVASSTGKFLSF